MSAILLFLKQAYHSMATYDRLTVKRTDPDVVPGCFKAYTDLLSHAHSVGRFATGCGQRHLNETTLI